MIPAITSHPPPVSRGEKAMEGNGPSTHTHTEDQYSRSRITAEPSLWLDSCWLEYGTGELASDVHRLSLTVDPQLLRRCTLMKHPASTCSGAVQHSGGAVKLSLHVNISSNIWLRSKSMLVKGMHAITYYVRVNYSVDVTLVGNRQIALEIMNCSTNSALLLLTECRNTSWM